MHDSNAFERAKYSSLKHNILGLILRHLRQRQCWSEGNSSHGIERALGLCGYMPAWGWAKWSCMVFLKLPLHALNITTARSLCRVKMLIPAARYMNLGSIYLVFLTEDSSKTVEVRMRFSCQGTISNQASLYPSNSSEFLRRQRQVLKDTNLRSIDVKIFPLLLEFHIAPLNRQPGGQEPFLPSVFKIFFSLFVEVCDRKSHPRL
ncbi:hypothetical protein VNO77_15564 [Canavalia gladiata]|uniref:Uncharacterized protein n=1 Tax=Canavalia gladiata TaxID=3824 RepID=A0AAN9M4G5_CANGL